MPRHTYRLLLLSLLCAACVDDDVGLPCRGPTPDPGNTVFSEHALDCQSRICIHYQSETAGPRCTAPCQSDDDCPTEPILGCQNGFVCRIAVPNATSPIACCGFCVCADDTSTGDPLAATCAGRPTHCPAP